ncbi:metallophosphoesterase [gamma proteobacterium HTCC5015]|nr:metallophosphoesterase [gamma proteobacterium HTCC5015]
MAKQRTDNIKIKKRHYRTLWLSDIHLGTRGCQADFLTDFLKHHSCDTLYLVGDIIDGWALKSRVYWPQSHTNVVRRILTLSKRGTRVVFVTGNHDEFLRQYSGRTFGNIELVDEIEHTTADGKRFLVIHGDQFDAVTRCHKWLSVLGSAAYDSIIQVNAHYNKVRAKLGYGYWSLSAFLKHRVKSAVNFISEFEHWVAHAAEKGGYDGVICGHIHHAEIRSIGEVTYMNCGDWVESCTGLAESEDGSIEILRWTRGEHNVVELLPDDMEKTDELGLIAELKLEQVL